MSGADTPSTFRTEITEQPEAAARLLESGREDAMRIAGAIRRVHPVGILIAARGSSDHAALYAKYLFQHRNGIVVALAAPSLFTTYRTPPRLARFCVFGISQSGAAPDVAAVIAEGRRQGALTLAISNDRGSELALTSDFVLDLNAGPERSVPASKTYTSTLLALAMLSQALDPDLAFERALAQVPRALDVALGSEGDAAATSRFLPGPRAIVLGRGFNFCTAEELALKLTETSSMMARAWSTADFMHGPVAIADPDVPVVVIRAQDAFARPMRDLLTVELCDGVEPDRQARATVAIASGLPEVLTPLPLAVVSQLVALHVAMSKRLDPDAPRRLRKVTRTW